MNLEKVITTLTPPIASTVGIIVADSKMLLGRNLTNIMSESRTRNKVILGGVLASAVIGYVNSTYYDEDREHSAVYSSLATASLTAAAYSYMIYREHRYSRVSPVLWAGKVGVASVLSAGLTWTAIVMGPE